MSGLLVIFISAYKSVRFLNHLLLMAPCQMQPTEIKGCCSFHFSPSSPKATSSLGTLCVFYIVTADSCSKCFPTAKWPAILPGSAKSFRTGPLPGSKPVPYIVGHFIVTGAIPDTNYYCISQDMQGYAIVTKDLQF